MRTIIATLMGLSLVLSIAPTVSAEDVQIGSGTIAAGGPHTEVQSIGGNVDAFFVDVTDVAGTVVKTSTVDNSGLGYDLDLYFYDAAGNYISGCYEVGTEESCTAPAGTATIEVAAWIGVDLDVTLLQELDDGR